MEAGAWDGDVIAEDHHAFLKCFFYSACKSAEESLLFGSTSTGYDTCGPRLSVRPIYLPVKSTSVSAPSYWRTWLERWHQARRHAQGVSELSYALLAACDALLTLPWKLQSFALYWQIGKVITRLWCMHLLPICQAISLVAVTAVWLYHGRHVPMCASTVLSDMFHLSAWKREEYLICALAGAKTLIWPIVIPTLLVIVANYLLINVAFLRRRKGKNVDQRTSIWHAEDGGAAQAGIGGIGGRLATFMLISWDCIFLVSVVMIPYGFIAEVCAYVDVAIHGNRVKYMTA